MFTISGFKAGFAAALAGAAGLGMAASIAHATDLYNPDPPARHGSAYDDPRYADLYGHPPPRGETYRRYENPAPDRRDNYAGPIPRERVYRDDDDRGGYDRRYADQGRAGCPSKDQISRRLERDGWSGFNNPHVIDRDTATVDARRPNGRPFQLQLDRCTGEVLSARPLDQRRFSDDRRYGDEPGRTGAYADDSRRWPRSY